MNPVLPTSPAPRRYPLVRILVVGFLGLLLQVPIGLVADLVRERAARREEVQREVSQHWGGSQLVAGPVLTVPYVKPGSPGDARGWETAATPAGVLVLLPESLSVVGELRSEHRQRGLFDVPVYETKLVLEGRFAVPELAALGVRPEDLRWTEAQLALEIGDLRGVAGELTLDWNNARLTTLPGLGAFSGPHPGVHAVLGSAIAAEGAGFKIAFGLKGSAALEFLPLARATSVNLRGDWPHPSFTGAWLPSTRKLEAAGFTATWEVSEVARNLPQIWPQGTIPGDRIEATRFGLTLIAPVDAYVMSERSVKYATLFIALTFLTIWLIDILAGIDLHPIQYLLVGAAMGVFYLLELALAEHVGFALAYLAASAAVTALNSAYCLAVLGGAGRAAIVTVVLGSLYGYLYVVLQEERYALLMGSVALFAALALVMWLTRKVDWHSIASTPLAELGRKPS